MGNDNAPKTVKTRKGTAANAGKASDSGTKAQGDLVHLRPSQILYTFSKILPYFSGCGRTLQSTLDQVASGEMTAHDLPAIAVISAEVVLGGSGGAGGDGGGGVDDGWSSDENGGGKRGGKGKREKTGGGGAGKASRSVSGVGGGGGGTDGFSSDEDGGGKKRGGKARKGGGGGGVGSGTGKARGGSDKGGPSKEVRFFSTNNRRLWVLRQCEHLGYLVGGLLKTRIVPRSKRCLLFRASV
jgi:hypothetical protein